MRCRKWSLVRFLARRRNSYTGFLFLTPVILLTLAICWWLMEAGAQALLPSITEETFHHFRRTTNLGDYLTDISVLIEPSSSPCASLVEVPVIVVVTSAPLRFEHRDAVRNTWAKHQPTLFFMGLNGPNVNEQLVDNYIEAKQHSDLVVFDFQDHYQNLTLKTALMLQWVLDRCPQAEFVFKTDDDVLINPWTLKNVLMDHPNAQLLGYKKNNTLAHHVPWSKWYLPRWLYKEDTILEYLSGTGYLINGEYIRKLLKAALKVPIINLEDVYLTYLVAKKSLGLTLIHDPRLTPYKPWLPFSCLYWTFASIHSLGPNEMVRIWSKIERISKDYESNPSVCEFYDKYFSSDFFLY